jgi:hypothetical protein
LTGIKAELRAQHPEWAQPEVTAAARERYREVQRLQRQLQPKQARGRPRSSGDIWQLRYSRSISGRMLLRLEFLVATGQHEQVWCAQRCGVGVPHAAYLRSTACLQRVHVLHIWGSVVVAACYCPSHPCCSTCCQSASICLHLLLLACLQVSLAKAFSITTPAWAAQYPDYASWTQMRLQHLRAHPSDWPPALVERLAAMASPARVQSAAAAAAGNSRIAAARAKARSGGTSAQEEGEGRQLTKHKAGGSKRIEHAADQQQQHGTPR